MKAVVFHGVGDIRLDDVSEPPLRDDTDAIVRLTASAICGTDLHMVRGTMSECGSAPFSVMRVSGSSSSSGRWCAISRSATASLSARRLPAAPAPIAAPAISPSAIRTIRTAAGPARRSSAAQVRPVHGLQAEKTRIPYAHVGMVAAPHPGDYRRQRTGQHHRDGTCQGPVSIGVECTAGGSKPRAKRAINSAEVSERLAPRPTRYPI